MNDNSPLPLYYRPGEVRALIDAYRRDRRKAMIKLVVYMVVVIVSLRVMGDFFLQRVPELAYLRPWLLPTVAVISLIGFMSGVLVIFHRSRVDLGKS